MRKPGTALLRKLLRLDRAAFAELVQAQFWLLRAQVLVWTRPVGKLASPAGAPEAQLVSGREAEAERIALAIGRAAENGVFRPLCLARAVALQRMLEGRGIHGSRIRIGVQKRGTQFSAHAWVEYGSLLLGDAEWHVDRFTPLTDVQPVGPG